MASGHKPGGGIASKQHVQIPVRTGTGSRSPNPGGVGQIGAMQGNHVTRYRGDRVHGLDRSFQPIEFGNKVALDVGKGGCGTGRTIYSCGTQSQHGDVAGSPQPQGRGFDDRG